jgi:hypothetical protein
MTPRDSHVLLGEIVEHPHGDRGGGVDHDCEETTPAVAQRGAVEIEDEEDEQGHGDGDGSQGVPLRHAHNGGREGKLRLAVHVVHAPVRSNSALLIRLPGLVEGFHQVVDELIVLGPLEEPPQEQRLVRVRGDRRLVGAATARPTDLCNDDRLGGKLLLQPAELPKGVAHGIVDRHAFPVRQQVNADKVAMLGELGMLQPDVPGLRGSHRLANRSAGPIQVSLELPEGHIPAQDNFVADKDPHDVQVGARQLDRRLELPFVVVTVVVDPRAHRNIDSVALRELRHITQRAIDAVGTDGVDLAGQQLQVGIDLGIGRHDMVSWILTAAEGRKGESLDVRGPRRLRCRAVQESPDGTRQGSEGRCDQQAR